MKRLDVLSLVVAVVAFAAATSVHRVRFDASAIPAKFAFGSLDLDAGARTVFERSPVPTADTYARPLFAPDRRPHQPQQETVQDEELPLPVMVEDEPPMVQEVEEPRFRLLGTDPRSEVASALLVTDETGRSAWFRKGEIVSGWVITKIGPNDIELSNGTDRQVNFRLPLYPDK